jgi:hypothetical protein
VGPGTRAPYCTSVQRVKGLILAASHALGEGRGPAPGARTAASHAPGRAEARRRAHRGPRAPPRPPAARRARGPARSGVARPRAAARARLAAPRRPPDAHVRRLDVAARSRARSAGSPIEARAQPQRIERRAARAATVVRGLRWRLPEAARPRPRQARGGRPGPPRKIAIGGRSTEVVPPPLPCRSGMRARGDPSSTWTTSRFERLSSETRRGSERVRPAPASQPLRSPAPSPRPPSCAAGRARRTGCRCR